MGETSRKRSRVSNDANPNEHASVGPAARISDHVGDGFAIGGQSPEFTTGSDGAALTQHLARMGGGPISRPMYTPQRVTLVRQLQQGIGNRAVQRMIQRASGHQPEAHHDAHTYAETGLDVEPAADAAGNVVQLSPAKQPIQRNGDGKEETTDSDGPFKLFKPVEETTKVAIFAHGVIDASNTVAPISGVELGYYSPHGTSVVTNLSSAESSPSHLPTIPGGDDQWASYVLSTIGALDESELQQFATKNGIAVAFIVDPTTTGDVVGALSGMGYADIRGVHCREPADGGEEFGVEIEEQEAEIVTKSHAELVSEKWQEYVENFGDVEDGVELSKDDALMHDGSTWKIVSVQTDDDAKSYTLEKV